jgi:two-component system, cell cycle response regulator DivK
MSKRILVVEDQPDNRQIIRDMLAPTDYEITEVESGEEVLTAIAKRRHDLILMDIRLPIMDGYTATSQIKADPALRSIPIIAVTSHALNGEEQTARVARSSSIVGFRRSSRSSRSSDPRPSCVGIVPAFAGIGAGNPDPLAVGRRSRQICGP